MQEPIAGVNPSDSLSQFGPFGRALVRVTKTTAVLGGLVFVGLVVMSIISIVGRKLASAPVPGDVEVLQMCSAVAASTFFAYCHLINGDVKVDFFTAHCRPTTVAWLDTFGSLLVGLFGMLIAWRTGVGAVSLYADGESSAILAWPSWIAQALIVPGFVLLGLAGFYMAAQHFGKARVTGSGAHPA